MTTPVSAQTPLQISSTIALAARKTGVDFDYLLTTARRESGLKTDAKSKSSSASGLFQFIDQTWLSTFRKYGAKHGFGELSEHIDRDARGKFKVADPKAREAIFALRLDPHAASVMAGELTREAAGQLQEKLGRAVDNGELYMAHFLGTSGAAKFIQAKESNPDALAAQGFGREAAANRSVFFEKSGKMKTMSEVYDHLTKLHGSEASQANAGQATEARAAKGKTTITPAPQPKSVSSPPRVDTSPAAGKAVDPNPASEGFRYSGLGYGGLGAITSRLTPQVLMILSSLDLPFGD